LDEIDHVGFSAGLLITTEAMIAERPKKEAGHPPMPGGGMGGMDY
jgi:chaperonin GroEL